MSKTTKTANRQKAARAFHRAKLFDRFVEISTSSAAQYAHVKCSSSPFTSGFFQG